MSVERPQQCSAHLGVAGQAQQPLRGLSALALEHQLIEASGAAGVLRTLEQAFLDQAIQSAPDLHRGVSKGLSEPIARQQRARMAPEKNQKVEVARGAHDTGLLEKIGDIGTDQVPTRRGL